MSARLKLRIDEDLKNADWPKRTDDNLSGEPSLKERTVAELETETVTFGVAEFSLACDEHNEFACRSAACRPPTSGGTGGSLPRGPGNATEVSTLGGKVQGAAKTTKTEKGRSPRLREETGKPVHNETEFTRTLRTAIDAEPALKGRKTFQEVEAEVNAEYGKRKREWEESIKSDLQSEYPVNVVLGSTSRLSGDPLDMYNRTDLSMAIKKAVGELANDPSMVPQTDLHLLAADLLKSREGSLSTEVFASGKVSWQGGEHMVFIRHEVDSLPSKRVTLGDSSITDEFEAASTRIGGLVRKEIDRRAEEYLAQRPAVDWDSITSISAQHSDATAGELNWSSYDGKNVSVWRKLPNGGIDPAPTDAGAQQLKKLLLSNPPFSPFRDVHERTLATAAEKKVFREVLAEVRSVGGPITGTPAHRAPKNKSDYSMHEQVRLATQVLPTDWIDLSNIVGTMTFKSVRNGRASYNFGENTVSLSGTVRVAVHELAHRMEWSAPGLRDLANKFLERRTAGETPEEMMKLAPNDGYTDPKEIAKPDKFFDPYVGKIYPSKSTEILSMGIEYLSDGQRKNIGMDDDYTDFVLGALATMVRGD